MPDAQQEVPAVCPDLRHAPDEVSTFSFSKKGKNNNQRKGNQGENDEPEQRVYSVQFIGKSLHLIINYQLLIINWKTHFRIRVNSSQCIIQTLIINN